MSDARRTPCLPPQPFLLFLQLQQRVPRASTSAPSTGRPTRQSVAGTIHSIACTSALCVRVMYNSTIDGRM